MGCILCSLCVQSANNATPTAPPSIRIQKTINYLKFNLEKQHRKKLPSVGFNIAILTKKAETLKRKYSAAVAQEWTDVRKGRKGRHWYFSGKEYGLFYDEETADGEERIRTGTDCKMDALSL